MQWRKRKRILLIIIALCVWLVWYVKFDGHHAVFKAQEVSSNFWGVTFSKKYAQELGLDWREAYIATIDDLGVKNIRLPVYWDDIEPQPGLFDFSEYEWMLKEGEARDVKFIVNIGRRLPRWPECHQPAWTGVLPEAHVDARHLVAAQTAFEFFREFDSIQYWQLENEYFFPWFGLCPEANPDLLQQEISYVRERDSRPIILTDSGELNSWRKAARYSDILGVTMYRVVWSNYFGYTRYPWPAALYRVKAAFADKDHSRMIVAELQAEPWPSHFQSVTAITPNEAAKSFSLRQFETNAEIARRTGFRQAYFWGVEWWYWMLKQGDSSMWEKAREIFKTGS